MAVRDAGGGGLIAGSHETSYKPWGYIMKKERMMCPLAHRVTKMVRNNELQAFSSLPGTW
jgi:hypothetical protein